MMPTTHIALFWEKPIYSQPRWESNSRKKLPVHYQVASLRGIGTRDMPIESFSY